MAALNSDQIDALLRSAKWMRGHEPDLGRELLQRGELVHRKRGQWLYAEGDLATDLIVVLEGLVQVSCAAPGGITCLIGQAGAGAILGQAVRLGGGPRLHTLVCAADSVLLRISDVTINDIAARRPETWRLVVGVLYAQLEGAIAVLTQTLTLPPRRRLAARLCMFANALGEVELSQTALAETLGLTRKTVNQHLAVFQREGLVHLAYGRIKILRREDLAAVAESELTGGVPV